MAICKNCGMEIRDDARFCTHCGAPNQPAAPRPDPYSGQNASYSTGGGASYGSSQNGAYGSGQNTSYSTGGGASYGSSQNTAYGNGGYASSYGRGPVPGPGFAEAVKTCLTKYADFNGRARRSEYWYFVLFNVLVSMVLSVVGNMIFGTPPNGGTNILVKIFSIAVMVPGLSVSWRRMHDIGKSGFWNLIALIPVIGWILAIVWHCRDSQPGPNTFGASPKYPYGA